MNEVPQGWAVAPLVDLIATDGIFTDGDWVESKDQDPNGEVRLIQLADVGEAVFINKSSRYLTRNKAVDLRCTFLQKDDLLIARMPDPLGRCCLFPLEGSKKYITVVDVCAIRVGTADIEHRYLMWAINLRASRNQIEALQSGSTRKRISRKNLATVSLPVPPLNEQRRIVERIEILFAEIDAGVESLEAARRALGLYRRSLLKAAFEGRLTAEWRAANPDLLETPDALLARIRAEREERHAAALADWKKSVAAWETGGRKGKKPGKPAPLDRIIPVSAKEINLLPNLPSEWRYGRLSDVAFVGSGMSVSSKRQVEDPINTPYLRVGNVQRGFLDLTEIRSMLVERSQLGALALKYADVLFNEGGDRDKLGRGWVWEEQIDPCITQNHVFRATPYRTDIDWSRFLSMWGNSFGRDYFEQGGKQTTNLASINKTVLKGLPVPLCSLAEQAEIVRILDARLDAADALSVEINAGLKRAKALRESILIEAFAGRLVPQDPDDEPAADLLARIRSEREAAPKPTRRRKTKASA